MVDPTVVFDAAADEYDFDRHHAAVADQLVAGIRRTGTPALVIDVATGTGAAAFSAMRRLEPRQVLAVDISPRMLELAQAKAARHDPGGRIDWRIALAVPLDVDDGSADLVLCASSLHFLGRGAVVEWLRVLRPGGRVAFSLPHAVDFAPSSTFQPLVADDLVLPSTTAQAGEIALEAGFRDVVVHMAAAASKDHPRYAFLVWAQAPLV